MNYENCESHEETIELNSDWETRRVRDHRSHKCNWMLISASRMFISLTQFQTHQKIVIEFVSHSFHYFADFSDSFHAFLASSLLLAQSHLILYSRRRRCCRAASPSRHYIVVKVRHVEM